jgi:prepilin-type N-terminal cleavage/methylation domain-containing protein
MKQKGFTLIELLVTMGIIAVLTGMAVFNFNQARARARDVQRKSDLSQIAKALELYRNDNNGKYPTSLSLTDQQTYLVSKGYSKVIFKDPKGTPSWIDYAYSSPIPYTDYTMTACLENTADPTKLVPVVPCGPATVGVIYQVKNQ